MTNISQLTIHPLPGFIICEAKSQEAQLGSFKMAGKETLEGNEGVVLAVGGSKQHDRFKEQMVPSPVQVGDHIHHRLYSESITYKGKRIRYVRFEDVLGVIDDTK